jgi:formylmethanofuran dehydrogenase subunit B
MQDQSARKATGERVTHKVFENVACPFCGMLCDDLEVESSDGVLKVRKNGCGRSIAGFERKLPPSSPQIQGKDVTLADAVKQAAALISKADSPLFGGLATGVEGMRAAMSLAERAGGIVDHALSEGQYRNVRVLQSAGWTTSTLTETRNRADLIIVVGSDIHKLHPRFFDRIVSPPDSMFDVMAPKRTVVFIGEVAERAAASGPQVGEVVMLACKVDQIGEVLGALRARLRGFRVNAKTAGGIALDKIDALAELCRQAKYGVVVWAPPTLDVPHAELTVEQATGLVKDLNQTQRFAGLSLGGNEGAVTAAAVSTWQSGFPLRISYVSGAPHFDPYCYSISRMLTAGEGDLLVWIASISPDLAPPATDVPTIVLGTPGLKLRRMPAVFIPVGTPGVDHAGRLIRCDSVVSLPLKNLHRAELPRVADVLASIEAAL